MTPKTPEEIRKVISELRTRHDAHMRSIGRNPSDYASLYADGAAALEYLLQFVEWKHIESAPKDGVEVLTLCKFEDDQDFRQIVLSFDVEEHPKWPWRDWDGQGIHADVPKRFLPLPPPPKQEDSK